MIVCRVTLTILAACLLFLAALVWIDVVNGRLQTLERRLELLEALR